MERTMAYRQHSQMVNRRWTLLASLAATLVLASAGSPARAADSDRSSVRDISASVLGADLAGTGAIRLSALGLSVAATDLRVWEIAPGEYLVSTSLPTGFRTTTTLTEDGATSIVVEYQVTASVPVRPRGSFDLGGQVLLTSDEGDNAAASGPTWNWLNQYCFSRMSNAFGWLDTCYVTHYLAGESDSRDFFQLEQYGTVAASFYGKDLRRVGGRPEGCRELGTQLDRLEPAG